MKGRGEHKVRVSEGGRECRKGRDAMPREEGTSTSGILAERTDDGDSEWKER